MNRMIASLVLAAFAAAPGPASGRECPIPQEAVGGQVIGARARLAYREITLYLKDGTVVLGLLFGADAESVRVLRDGPDLDVPFRDIEKAVIRADGKASRGVLPGVAMGLFLGTGLSFRAFSHPGNYMPRLNFDNEYGVLPILFFGFIESACAAAGGALGSVVASGTSHKSFDFPGDPEKIHETRDRFLQFINGEIPPARFHFLIQGGHVDPGVSRKLDAAIEEAGFTFRYLWTPATNFSILRGLELSYSIKPRLRTGLRMSFPSEPVREATLDDEFWDWAYLTHEFRATAFHAICSVEPFRRTPSDTLSWSVGLGIGAAAVRLRRGMWAYRDNGLISGEAEISKTLPSAVAFTTLQIRLNEILTAGIAADFTFIPATTVPGLPDLGLPVRKVGLGNASVGFVLGYHF